jgi:hypothetical protein
MSDFKLSATLLMASSSSIHSSVPPILDSIVTTASQSSGDLSPTFAHLGDHLLDQHSLLGRDRVMVQVRLQVLMKPFATLLG